MPRARRSAVRPSPAFRGGGAPSMWGASPPSSATVGVTSSQRRKGLGKKRADFRDPPAARLLVGMMLMEQEGGSAGGQHVPGVTCFRTCRHCRALASGPRLPVPRHQQPASQLAAALEKGLSLSGGDATPKSLSLGGESSPSSPSEGSPNGIWSGIANLSFCEPVPSATAPPQPPRRPPPGCCAGCFDSRGAHTPATVVLPACGHLGLCVPCSEIVALQAAVAWATPQSPQSQQLSLALCPICRKP